MKFITSTMLVFFAATATCSGQSSSSSHSPVSAFAYDRTRLDAWQWYAAPPYQETTGYVESLIRIGVAQRVQHWDWLLEISQPTILDAPSDSVSKNTAQGQLGLGATYYAANGNNPYPVAAFLKQGYLRYHFAGNDKNLRLGRFEFFDGTEMQPKNPELLWLQTNRVASRLISNFGFSNAQRSLDGVDGHYGQGFWDITGMAARADQGVFNMNGNPELNVDTQYLAFSKFEWNQHFLWRAFAIGYHDGRTGIVKTDNRPLAVRKADKHNIRIGTYGGDFLTTIPAGTGEFDLMGWGLLQNGNWGVQSHSASAGTIEGGYRFTHVTSRPWLRGGWLVTSGDNNPNDNQHQTFFQLLPTPRLYARFPFYDMMNSKDGFIQAIDNPTRRLELRSDLHWLQLTSGNDLWYQGGGAFDNKVFGYVGRPGNGHSPFATVADISADWQATRALAVNLYYAYASGKSVVSGIYPTDSNAQFGYVEFVYRWGLPQRSAK